MKPDGKNVKRLTLDELLAWAVRVEQQASLYTAWFESMGDGVRASGDFGVLAMKVDAIKRESRRIAEITHEIVEDY